VSPAAIGRENPSMSQDMGVELPIQAHSLRLVPRIEMETVQMVMRGRARE
jgi:hypothetical protein